MATTGSDVWKWVAGMLSSILATGLIAWFSFGGGVSRAEGQELKAKDAALERQQAVIEERIAHQSKTLEEIKATNKEISSKLDDVRNALNSRGGRDSGP